MKKLLAMLLIFSLLSACFAGCGKNPQPGVSAPSYQPMLPKSLNMDVDGQPCTVDFVWTENSCSIQIPNKGTYEFTFENNTLTFFADGSKTNPFLQYTLDGQGYITNIAFPSEDMTGAIAYTEDHSSFTWTMSDGETVQGTVSPGRIGFAKPDILDISFGYQNAFVTDIRDQTGIAYDFQPKTDESGTLTQISVSTGGEPGLVMTLTPSELPMTQPWQKIPVLFFAQYTYGFAAMITAMGSITSCYTGRAS